MDLDHRMAKAKTKKGRIMEVIFEYASADKDGVPAPYRLTDTKGETQNKKN